MNRVQSSLQKLVKSLSMASLLAACVAVFSGTLVVEASANTSLCRSLEAQLTSGKSGGSRKYANAARKQRAELGKVQRRYRENDCHLPAIFRFGRDDGGQCRYLQQTMRKMQANLSKLEARAGGRGLTKAERHRILTRLDVNGCRDRNLPRSITVKKPDRQLPQLKNRIVVRGPNGEIPVTSGLLVGTYRTMCVRTCDGYYFPISFSTHQSEFERDRLICESMCPGTEARLYFHAVPDQESEDMVSLTGEPYIDHPNALRYRSVNNTRDPSCSCQAVTNKGYTVLAGRTQADANPGDPEGTAPPIPTPRPDPLEDPETLADHAGNFGPDQVRALLGKVRRNGDEPVEGIRVVGPVFLPDPEGAIDLKAPARNSFP